MILGPFLLITMNPYLHVDNFGLCSVIFYHLLVITTIIINTDQILANTL